MDLKNFSVHLEFAVLFITLVGGFYMVDGKIDRQGSRTDRLYEIYCENVERSAQNFQRMDDRFYDFIRENNK